MSFLELKLAELLCTRLIHDITGPIGAVNNGAEFLKEEGFDMQNQAIDLITSSASEAVNRLQFYRKAYGRINDDGEASLADNKKITHDFLAGAGSKIKLDWPDIHTDASGVSVSRKMARLVINLIIISTTTLIRGGTISVRVTAIGGDENSPYDKQISVEASGTHIKWEKEMEQILSGQTGDADLTPKTVQPYFTRKLAEEISIELNWEVSEKSCVLTALHRQSSLPL